MTSSACPRAGSTCRLAYDDRVPISSNSLPILEETCLEWLRRLAGDPSQRALMFRCEAQGLVAYLRTWRARRPSDKERTGAVQRVMDFHSRASAFYGHGRKPRA